jgi:hypothetical protein
MKTIQRSVFAVLILLFQYANAQEQPVNTTGKISVIPFELTQHNLIAIKAILNNTDTVTLMFHTAASALALTEESIKKLKSLHFSGTDTVGSWGGGGNAARFSPGNTLQIGNLRWNNTPLWEDKNSGHGTDGKFGPNLFTNKVVEIDFDKKQIVLHTTLPPKARKYEQLHLTNSNDMLFIEAACQTGKEIITNKFLLHSGYAGSLLLDDKFVADHQLGNTLTITGEKELKDAYGNVIKTKKAILPVLMIGKQALTNAPAGFFEGAIGRQKMSIMGFDILKRFNLIIDAQRTHIYLKANKLKNTAWMNV